MRLTIVVAHDGKPIATTGSFYDPARANREAQKLRARIAERGREEGSDPFATGYEVHVVPMKEPHEA